MSEIDRILQMADQHDNLAKRYRRMAVQMAACGDDAGAQRTREASRREVNLASRLRRLSDVRA